MSNPDVAELTGVSRETVRRIRAGQAPSAEFVGAICEKLGINAEWLVSGVGPRRIDDLPIAALEEVPTADLAAAIAGQLDRLTTRVDRLERDVALIQTRVGLATRRDR